MKKIILITFLLVCGTFSFAADPLYSTSSLNTKVLIRSTQMWDGTPLPSYPTTKPEITVARIVIPPHAQIPWHKHPSIVAAYIVSGTLLVQDANGKKHTVKAGDAFVELVNKWHYGKNNGNVPVVLVAFFVGTPHMPVSILKKN